MPESRFIKSSYSSSGGECVEVALGVTDTVAVRDSKDPDGPVLHLSPTAWTRFTSTVSGGGSARRGRGPGTLAG